MSSWVGIDVSKNTLAVWVRPSGVNFIVCNSSEGHQALLLNLAESRLNGCFWRPPAVTSVP